jgi:hypothetical protein
MSGMIIPAKSTIEEEDIKIPYGQDKRESSSTTMDERSTEHFRDMSGNTDGDQDSASEYLSPRSPQSPPAGLGGLVARLRNVEDDDDGVNTGGKSGGEEYYGRTSMSSDRGGPGSRMMVGRGGPSEDQERMRRDYEFKIATMQKQLANLTKELEDVHAVNERRKNEGEEKLQSKTEELENVLWVSPRDYAHAYREPIIPYSGCRTKQILLYRCGKSWMNLRRQGDEKRKGKPGGCKTSRMSCES